MENLSRMKFFCKLWPQNRQTAQMSCMAHKCGFQEVRISSLFKHQLIFVTGQNCLTFLGIDFINSKMNRLNHKISLFSSALTFSDSNRKNQPYSYHVLHLKRNKTLVLFPILFSPFLFLHPQMPSPPHDCYRKWYWKSDPLVALNTLPKISLNY